MSTTHRIQLAGLSLLALTAALAFAVAPPTEPPYRVSSPVRHENLTVFFLLGEDQIKGKTILTLDEALKAKKVVVHETKNVNELAIENVSDAEVFVQAGDIVKGGQQDRTIALDALVPPRSGRLPVSSFCVEQGRWSKRGGEDASRFSDSARCIVGNDLKIAARREKSQGGVWKEVAVAQDKLAMATRSDVKDSRSQSSLQLTLENKKVHEAIAAYVKALEDSLPCAKAGNVVGYAVAINGKVMSADVYANGDLFRRLWPKLLRASVTEAVSERKERVKVEEVKEAAVTAFLADAASGKRTERKALRDQKEAQLETTKNVLFETTAPAGAVLRRSYLAK
ncbi:MAG: DUF6569 family protein [Gemmataceae bacterium]